LNGKERLLALSLKRLLNRLLNSMIELVLNSRTHGLNGAPLCARCFKDGALWRGDEIRRLERPFEVQWVGTILCALNWQ